MSAESNARSRVAAFHWWAGCLELSQAQAELRDLAALRDAVEDATALHSRAVVTFEGVSWVTVVAALSISPASVRSRYER